MTFVFDRAAARARDRARKQRKQSPGTVAASPYAIERPGTYVPRPVPKLAAGTDPAAGSTAGSATKDSAPKPGPATAAKASGATSGEPSDPPRLERPPYPSDISDGHWKLIRPLVIRQQGRGRRPTVNLRDVLDAMQYRWTTQCAWRMLPHDFPSWNTVYFYYRSWRKSGLLPRLQSILETGDTAATIAAAKLPAAGRSA